MNKKHLTREALLKIIETDQAQCGETSVLACIVLAAIDNEISLTRNIVPEEMNIGTAMKFWGGGCGSIDSFVAGYNLCRTDMLAALPQLPGSEPSAVPGKWIPVSERMLEKSQTVLISVNFDSSLVEPLICTARYTGSTFRRGDAMVKPGTDVEEATHWMPLPAAPQGVK